MPNDSPLKLGEALHTSINTKVMEVLPLRESLVRDKLLGQKAASRVNATRVPEMFVIGEICLGERFANARSGLACDWHFQWDDPWVLLEVL
eukprot:CAMPEP_0119259286 /NCGR_PEP_ID=MMETSP1329-20130426/155_1 /TAXON_ID=114041 /ORGANISM="Genus nov. species nov., Strain RCC1024" /LENGTH=90 /DNA_ID=CAMNT_0007258655 /DNA_START=50 /DNA_END=322 /DNA_ORIENTATION=-